jgi:hydrogenase-4 component B
MIEQFATMNTFFWALGILLFGGCAGFIVSRIATQKMTDGVTQGSAFLASLLTSLFSGSILYQGVGVAKSFESAFPLLSFSFHVDGLSAFFLLIISVVAMMASLYGIGYRKQSGGHYRSESFGFFYALFLAGLFLVPVANNALFFLVVWEIMSLASYFLVVTEYHDEKNVRAGFLYFLMTHFGTAFITLSFFLAQQATGSFDFDMWRTAFGSIDTMTLSWIYGLALLGFGTKAGIIPLHIWLPEAHPAAPSHVSALMSGVMLKTAVFMIIRFFFDFFPGAPMEWGLLLLVLGSISAVLGVMYALSESDVKRMLAYSSIENIGIIFLGIGSAVVALGYGMEKFAFFGLAAALYHTMNHAMFKSLLFLGAGSVVSATGTRNMERYGGLIRVMPYTAVLFLIGSMAISALPPLNGFASEWLTFQSLFIGASSPSIFVKSIFIGSIAALALTGGLVAACFVKAFGITFLARPRSDVARDAQEVSFFMLVPMGVLSLLLLLLGVFSTTVIAALVGVVGSIAPATGDPMHFIFWEFIENRSMFASVLPLEWVALGLAVALISLVGIVQWSARNRSVSIVRTWDCGEDLNSRTEITGASFSRALQTIFQGVLRPTKQTDVEYHDEALRYFIKSRTVTTDRVDVYQDYLYRPLQNGLGWLGDKAKLIQTGNINTYLLYVFMTLLVLLIVATK